jgi:hypothetical protein
LRKRDEYLGGDGGRKGWRDGMEYDGGVLPPNAYNRLPNPVITPVTQNIQKNHVDGLYIKSTSSLWSPLA